MTFSDFTRLKQVKLEGRVIALGESEVVRTFQLAVDLTAPDATSIPASQAPDIDPAEFHAEDSLYLVEYYWVSPPVDQPYRYEVAAGPDKRIYILRNAPLFVCNSREGQPALKEALAWMEAQVREQVRQYVSRALRQSGESPQRRRER